MRRRHVLQGISSALAAPALCNASAMQPSVSESASPAAALVIGISQYHHMAPLPSAVRDAHLIAASLTLLGFRTQFSLNPTASDLHQTLRVFQHRARHTDLMVVYVAAHGVQIDGGVHMFAADAYSSAQSLSGDTLIRALSDQPRNKILFLDCCRTPIGTPRQDFAVQGESGFELNASQPATTSVAGLHVTYAAQPGAPALDGDDAYSPFASALHRALKVPGLDMADLTRRLRLDVVQSTGGLQLPWSRSSLLMRVVLHAPHRAELIRR